MSTYLLIHGAWHGAWCWNKVVPLLEQAGHTAIAIDLPGHGQDTTPLSEVTLAAYTQRVSTVLDMQTEQVILIGHSMGGIAISQAAESRPQKIKTLVYLTAFLLPNGVAMRHMAEMDTDSLLEPNLIVNTTEGFMIVKDEAIRQAFYGDCSDEDVTRAKTLLCPQALAPDGTPVNVTPENFGQVPRVYIECVHDRAITPYIQKLMYTNLPCQQVITMNTCHSPFFSAPEVLVAHLLSF